MAFLEPWWLLLLALWPLLVLMMRSRDQRAVRPAPDFLLWQRAAARLPRAASRARLSLADGLWIVPLALLTLGLARPEWRRKPQAQEVVVIVDRSASMATKGEDGATRLERGIREARRILGSAPSRLEGIPPGGEAGRPSTASVDPAELAESAVLTHAAGVPVLVVTDLPPEGLADAIGLVAVTDGARNAGITAAGFDPSSGLVVRVEADPGAGPRTLTITDARGSVLLSRELRDPSSFREVLPPAALQGASPPVTLRLTPPDAMPLDDVVALTSSRRGLTAAIERPSPPLERALRAHPGVNVVSGSDSRADLVVGAGPAGPPFRLLLAPVAGVDGFESGPPAPVEGAMTGTGLFAGLAGPSRWRAVHPLVKAPPGTERLLEAGGAPLLVRQGRTFVLLAEPDENGWSSVPSFPLAIARIVELVGAEAGARLEPDSAAVLSPDETLVARGPAAPGRAPAQREGAGAMIPLAPWCYAAAAAVVLAILLATVISRRAAATPRSRPASALAGAIRRTERS